MIRLRGSPALGAAARKLSLKLVGLGRYQKRAILVVSDLIVLGIALWLAMSLRLGEFYTVPSRPLFLIFWAAPVIGVVTFFQLGLYRLVTRYIGGQGVVLIPVAVGLSALYWAVAVLLSGVSGVPRSVVILYPMLATALILLSRQAAGWLLKRGGIELPARVRGTAKAVLIYGAGTAGVQLLEALRNSGNYVPVGFVDKSPTIWGQYVGGLKVFRPERMAALIERHGVEEVLLAMTDAQRRERQEALEQLASLTVRVRVLPAIEDLASGRVTVSDLRSVEVEDLLGRDPIPSNAALLARNIKDKSVMVTGAGGSIGSELVREVLRHAPRRLILFERSEAQLYEIDHKVQGLAEGPLRTGGGRPKIVSVLGSIQDGALVRRTIERNGVETIYHAAAFKHVPIVEHNPVAGLRNNTLGTALLAEIAESCGVERFVLVSTDKAVRPTSIMGASKRLAEMVLQARAAEGSGRTVFTMVRFGNVLNSSGSVMRRFQQQIEAGGPVTVTHRDMSRYFMSIPEAAALVIQAGAMATGGDVFVLDMGEPVKIDDLARSMIRLMGREVHDGQQANGGIAITYIGPRDGEKLYEELLLGKNITPTEHQRIMRSHEPFMRPADLEATLEELRAAMASGDVEAIRAVLVGAVEGYGLEPRDAGGREAREPGAPQSAALGT